MKAIAGYLRDGKPLPITIVGGDVNGEKVVPLRQPDQPDDKTA
jgi:hypothetical protein